MWQMTNFSKSCIRSDNEYGRTQRYDDKIISLLSL